MERKVINVVQFAGIDGGRKDEMDRSRKLSLSPCCIGTKKDGKG